MRSDGDLKQISLVGNDLAEPYLDTFFRQEKYEEEVKAFRQKLRQSCRQWPHGFDIAANPYPIIIPESLTDHLDRLGDILCRATTNIVERWWKDPSANFPERMPLSPQQERILRWIEFEGKSSVPSFATRRGVWRPDFLFNTQPRDEHINDRNLVLQNPQICEINSRFAFNAFFGCAFTHEAYQSIGFQELGLKSPVDPPKIFEAYKNMLDLDKPIHLLKGIEPGLDIHLFESFIRQRCGLKARFIKPKDLRLINHGLTSILCCTLAEPQSQYQKKENSNHNRMRSTDGEVVEQIYQVGLELHQGELDMLTDDMLKAIAPLCFNDLRTILLVHDKRMLGVILQELNSLVQDYKILTVEEESILRAGIAPTILPRSPELKKLLRCTEIELEVKDNYLLKPAGSGKGDGIVFGTDIKKEQWMNWLLQLSKPHFGPEYIVQRVAQQPKFDVLVEKEAKLVLQHNYFVGTFMMLDGQNLGIAGWRTGPGRICAVSNGGTWVCSLLRDSTAPVVTATTIPRLLATSLGDSRNNSHVRSLRNVLDKDGIIIVSLKFPDPDSMYLFNLVQNLGQQHSHGPPLNHSSTHGCFWDVKPIDENISKNHKARSETMDKFPWHTDCSYAAEPPRFFGLQVLQADKYGGGTLSVLSLEKVLQRLSKEAIETLHAQEFRIEVPPEFQNGSESTTGSLLISEGEGYMDFQHTRCRYREDITHPLTERAERALKEISNVLEQGRNGSNKCLNLTAEMIPNGSVVLMDNGRWFHARNEVHDPERHLRRIRWDAREFQNKKFGVI